MLSNNIMIISNFPWVLEWHKNLFILFLHVNEAHKEPERTPLLCKVLLTFLAQLKKCKLKGITNILIRFEYRVVNRKFKLWLFTISINVLWQNLIPGYLPFFSCFIFLKSESCLHSVQSIKLEKVELWFSYFGPVPQYNVELLKMSEQKSVQ